VELNGKQWQELSEALRSAFNYNRFLRLLQFRLEKSLQDITLASEFEQVVFDVIERAEAEGWTMRLITAARESAPDNLKLIAFAQQFELVSTDASRATLEQTIVETNSFLDVDAWLENAGRVEPCVCRIEVKLNGRMAYGSGFLVGPSLLVTNYHVMEAVILGEQGKTTSSGLSATRDDLVLRFDYKRLGDGDVVNPGVEHKLAENWLETSSPYSSADLKNAGDSLPAPNELDFVLARLEKAAGNEKVGGSGEPESSARGWLEVPDSVHEFVPDSSLFILQHPEGAPLKLALDTHSVIGVNANGTRVRHRTNTEGGSSGSPCFDENWNLVALHHSGDPNYDGINPPGYNRAIPIAAIRGLLGDRDLVKTLG
jgi:hypothetical protein